MDVSVARLRCQFRLLRNNGIRHRGGIAGQKELTGLDSPSKIFVMHGRTDQWIKDLANSSPNMREYPVKVLFKLPADQKKLVQVLSRLGL